MAASGVGIYIHFLPQPHPHLSAPPVTAVGSTSTGSTVLVNGKRFTDEPGSIPLANFSNIVLELGKPPAVTPPAAYDFSSMRR